MALRAVPRSFPAATKTPPMIIPERPMPCRQCTATCLPASSASTISAASSATDSREAGTPRSGMGNDLKSIPLARAAAASPSKSSCACSSASRSDTTTSMPASRQEVVSSPSQSPPRGRGRMPSRPRHGPATQNTFAGMIPSSQIPEETALEEGRRCRRRARATRRADGALPARFHPFSPSVHRAALDEASRRVDRSRSYETDRASPGSG